MPECMEDRLSYMYFKMTKRLEDYIKAEEDLSLIKDAPELYIKGPRYRI